MLSISRMLGTVRAFGKGNRHDRSLDCGVQIFSTQDADTFCPLKTVVCFGGVEGAMADNCWRTCVDTLLLGHSAVIIVESDPAALLLRGTQIGGVPVGEIIANAAASCGLNLDIVSVVGYSAGADVALQVAEQLPSVQRALVVSGYFGGCSRLAVAYLAWRQHAYRSALFQLDSIMQLKRGLVRPDVEVTVLRSDSSLCLFEDRPANLAKRLDELVARRCALIALQTAGDNWSDRPSSVDTHEWALWREAAIDFLESNQWSV